MKKLLIICMIIFGGCTFKKMLPPSNPDDRFMLDDLNNSEANISQLMNSPFLFTGTDKKTSTNDYIKVDSPSNPIGRFTPTDISNDYELNSTEEKKDSKSNSNIEPQQKDEK